GHVLDGGVLLGLVEACAFLVPGPRPRQPVPTLGPAANGSGGAGLASTRWLLPLPLGAVIAATGRIEAAAWPQIAAQTESRVRLRGFARPWFPRRCHRCLLRCRNPYPACRPPSVARAAKHPTAAHSSGL